MERIIQELIECQAFKKIPGRKYKHYRDFDKSLISDLDISGIFKWISNHVNLVRKKKTAR